MSTESQPASRDADHDRLPPHRKNIVFAVLAFCRLLAPIASTTVLAAVPELAETYHTDAEVINLSNEFYIVFMGLSPLHATLLFTSSILTALSPPLAAFYAFRVLTAYPSTAFLVLAQSIVGDMYIPTKRGTATGYVLTGSLAGPALGPFVRGIIVNYSSWRGIVWLQTALAGWLLCCCVGWLSPITGTLLVISTIGICFTIRSDKDWREKRDVSDAETEAVVEPKGAPTPSASPHSNSGAEGDKEVEVI
ncbi:hypothetical protein W97_01012 [Coniosporium apollinis CBS 100218]|uniref:Major facilitator superfamily (MFS) profile domain-containing protein n=1 Tax=Coniosporium apollinis (strain CBS 100218) TaxID=1168221 RepID=R7YIQ6_CONA1|nr:uncharacterized protein W97_01012 [Coniosporium apollinis CBS 100218]EON61795.1 hypothetical protein W97_01012 [Coniosporium apollinis CBS 100218]